MGNYPGKERHGSAGTADAFQTPPTSPTDPSTVSPGYFQPFSSPTHPERTFSSPTHPERTFSSPTHPERTFSSPTHPERTFSSPTHPEQIFSSPTHPDRTFSSPTHPDRTFSCPTHPDLNLPLGKTPSPTTAIPLVCPSSDGVKDKNRKANDCPTNSSNGRQNSASVLPMQVDLPPSGRSRKEEVEQELVQKCVTSLGLCENDEKTHTLSDVLQCFLTEREQMKNELRSLKEKMKTERSEWLQFQSDLQVALVVADRLRAEAEEGLSVLREARADWERQLTNSIQGQREVESQVEHLKAELEQNKQRISQKTETPSQQGATEGYTRSILERCGDVQRTGGEKRKEKEAGTTEIPKKPSASSVSLINGTSKIPSAPITSPVKNSNLTRERQNTEHQDNGIHLNKDKKEDSPCLHPSPVRERSTNKPSKIKPQEDVSKLLRRFGGSKRNSLLRWCQNRTSGYKNIDITNFSSSWIDGLAFCAMYHSYLPSHIPYDTLRPENKKENLMLAFQTGERVGINASLTAEEMLKNEGPDWQRVLGYVESIYSHFEM